LVIMWLLYKHSFSKCACFVVHLRFGQNIQQLIQIFIFLFLKKYIMCFIIYLHLKKNLCNNCFGLDTWISNGMLKVNAWEGNPWKCPRIQRGLHVMMYTKNSHNLTIFSTYSSFMHHGGNLKNNFHSNFVIMIFMSQSSIILWNQCTYEWNNSSTKYSFDLQNLEASL
jgi:hypothetical protein